MYYLNENIIEGAENEEDEDEEEGGNGKEGAENENEEGGKKYIEDEKPWVIFENIKSDPGGLGVWSFSTCMEHLISGEKNYEHNLKICKNNYNKFKHIKACGKENDLGDINKLNKYQKIKKIIDVNEQSKDNERKCPIELHTKNEENDNENENDNDNENENDNGNEEEEMPDPVLPIKIEKPTIKKIEKPTIKGIKMPTIKGVKMPQRKSMSNESVGRYMRGRR
tara:strand:- start:456 stop:1127 length:672 start_codon:yes stop_codon:yes gene_type:complete